jgi:hypothetical protein
MYDKEVNIAMYGHADSSVDFVDDDGLPPPASINPGPRLAAYCEHFNATINICKSSKAEKTFTNHQNNHTRFILWLYENNRQYIIDELAHSLDDIIIDYSPIINRHSRYRRNGGKKSLEERRQEYRIKVLRAEISAWLGTPGTTPVGDVVNFPALVSNLDVFLDY